MSRTFSTSSIQREVIQAQGQSGSNQKSTGVLPVTVAFSDMSLLKRRSHLCARTPPTGPAIPALPGPARHMGGSDCSNVTQKECTRAR